MGADICQGQMIRIDDAWSLFGIKSIVGYAGTTDDERVDAQVERRCAGRVLGSQGVNHELEVGLAVCRRPVEFGVGSEELSRCNGNLPFCQLHQVNACRQSGGF